MRARCWKARATSRTRRSRPTGHRAAAPDVRGRPRLRQYAGPGARLCDALDPGRSGALGVAVDVYHAWWEPRLEQQIERAGRERLLPLHVCDKRVPTKDLLNDRGMMGDGVIEIAKIRGWVEAAGFVGYRCSEVEIFSADWWGREGGAVLDTRIEPHSTVV